MAEELLRTVKKYKEEIRLGLDCQTPSMWATILAT